MLRVVLAALAAAVLLLAQVAEAPAAPDPDPLPLKDLFSQVGKTLDKAAKDVGKAVNKVVKEVRKRCSCNVKDLSCRCCERVKIPEVKFNEEICLNTKFQLKDFTAVINVIVARNTIFRHHIAMNKTPPICVPVPKVPVVKLCVQAHGLSIVKERMRVCINLDVKVVSQTVVSVRFDCMHIDLPKKKKG